MSWAGDLPQRGEHASLLEESDGRALRSGLVVLKPGADCGWHSSEDHEELILCLAGAGELAAEDAGPMPLSAGQYAYNPPHTRHCVFNTGEEPMRYVYVAVPTRLVGM